MSEQKAEPQKQKPAEAKPEAKGAKPAAAPAQPKPAAAKQEKAAAPRQKRQKFPFDQNSVLLDASDAVLGRLASVAAKKALDGKKVFIINAENAIISGDRYKTLAMWKFLRGEIGSRYHGPYFPRRPDMFVRRSIRGMLPWKRSRGRDAYRRIRVYIGVPDELQGKVAAKPDAILDNLGTLRFARIGPLCKQLGWKQ
ncbi:MAG: 50S ribosomal protein L13 [archaeon]